MSFFSSVISETAAEREFLYNVPQIRDGLEGQISRESYIAYLTEAYHHVRHTVPLMQATKSRLGDSHARYREALDEYIADETGHEEWILSDIGHAGGDVGAARASQPRFETEVMVAYAYDYVTRINPMGFFGMVFVLEGTSTQLATNGAGALQESLGLPATAFTYLNSHGALDQEHILFLKSLLDGIEDEADRAAVMHMARRMFRLYAGVFSAIPHWRYAHAV